MKILHVISTLEYGGAANELSMLAICQLNSEHTARVFTLEQEAGVCDGLRRVGIPVTCGNWRRWIDVQPLMELRREIREFAPDVIHAWGLPALRAVAATGPGRQRFLLSAALHAGRTMPMSRLDRLLLSWSDARVTVRGPAERQRYHSLGVPVRKIVEVPLAVGLTGPTGLSQAEVCRLLNLPDKARYLCAVGPLEPSKGLRDAVWAFDILQFLYDDLHLLIVGSGSEEPRLRDFTRIAQLTERVHFLGRRTDLLTILLPHAEMVWVPSRAERGLNVALEAMSAYKPVIAARWPMLCEVVIDSETGVLVTPGDKGALARETRLLLDDAERRARLGKAGQRRVEERFGLDAMKRRFDELYSSYAPNTPLRVARTAANH
jgi:glycosyltransferase involved in cell wall biosynthesis